MRRRPWLVPLTALALFACDEEPGAGDFGCDETGEICGPVFCVGDQAEIPLCDDGECTARVVTCPEGTRCGPSGCEPIPGQCLPDGRPCADPVCVGDIRLDFTCAAGACLATPVECPAGSVCADGACLPGACVDDDDCGPAVCLGFTRLGFACVGGRCEAARSLCPRDTTCVGGECVAETPRCDPGSVCAAPICDGDAVIASVCSAEGFCLDERVPCAAGETCDAGRCVLFDIGAACAVPGSVCAPPACQGDASVLGVCGENRLCQPRVTPCGDGRICVDGDCLRPDAPPEPCDTLGAACGPPTCIGDAAAGAFCQRVDRDDPASPLTCQESFVECLFGDQCVDGFCVADAQPCERPGQLCGAAGCDGDDNRVAFSCDENLRCVPVRTPCLADEICLGGACFADDIRCEPGSICGGPDCDRGDRVVNACQPDGFCDIERTRCPEGTICQDGACSGLFEIDDAPCRAPNAVCAPPVCQGDASVIGLCSADLVCEPRVTPCGEDRVCAVGQCLLARAPAPCDVEGVECGPRSCLDNASSRFFCQRLGNRPDGPLICLESFSHCVNGDTCVDGLCFPEQTPCEEEGESCARDDLCDGPDAFLDFTCNAELECVPIRRACPPGESCIGESCSEDIVPCDPGSVCAAPICDGDAVIASVCSAEGFCLEERVPCAAGETCDAGVCTRFVAGCDAPGEPCGEAVCEGDTAVRFACDDGLACARTEEQCAEGSVCVAGECVVPDPRCPEPGILCQQPFCDGDRPSFGVCDARLACDLRARDCRADQRCAGGGCFRRDPFDPCLSEGQPCSEPVCDGDRVVSFSCNANLRCVESARDCAAGGTCAGGICQFQVADGFCACSTPGATVGPAEQGCGFDDNNQCSGWQSVIIGAEARDFSPENEAEALNRVVPDGSVYCAFDCCMQIGCP